jgi:hypothetical protein
MVLVGPGPPARSALQVLRSLQVALGPSSAPFQGPDHPTDRVVGFKLSRGPSAARLRRETWLRPVARHGPGPSRDIVAEARLRACACGTRLPALYCVERGPSVLCLADSAGLVVDCCRCVRAPWWRQVEAAIRLKERWETRRSVRTDALHQVPARAEASGALGKDACGNGMGTWRFRSGRAEASWAWWIAQQTQASS